MRRVFSHAEDKSNALVNPWRVSICCNCRPSSGAGIAAAFAHFRSKKWTWLFQKPAVIVSPEQSRAAVPSGSSIDALLPTAAIVPPWRSTTPSRMASAVGST